MALTISETVARLHDALTRYIEATYHISHPQLIAQRRELLEQPGIICQAPYIESTPRYQSNRRLADLGLNDDVLAFLTSLCTPSKDAPRLFYDPPYEHQAGALQGALVDNKSLLVMTGTGSGKTECFLLPILGKLAYEACHSHDSFRQPAMRALLLYPMNALVNDQLGRLRLSFGDYRVVDQFIAWSDRPARFARYTSRTLYPGVRNRKKDGQRLKSIETFYIDLLERAKGGTPDDRARASTLILELQKRGRWPAKADLAAWYGKKGSWWQNKQGEFIRAVTQARDAELFTRHEVQVAPPDVLVTNYSMLEYMLMRPLERPVFDQTRDWLRANPDESFLLVVDEAHMYRGASGAEVALLLRRLRKRLEIPADRLQVICTSASFKDQAYAIEFAARLAGKRVADFAPPIGGELALHGSAASGDAPDALELSSIDLDGFFAAEYANTRRTIVSDLLAYRKVNSTEEPVEQLLHRALHDYPPMGELINRTMQRACPIDELGAALFGSVDKAQADRAVTALATLGSIARADPEQPGLLPCRVHAFFRGLPGLWACLDPNCTVLHLNERGQGPTGKLYGQPYDRCSCGARVLELFTCRNCGTAYARAYTDDLMNPHYLWEGPGTNVRTFAGAVMEFEPLDLLLEDPPSGYASDLVVYDLLTGQVNPTVSSGRCRDVYLPKSRFNSPDSGHPENRPGQFRPCAACGSQASFGRSSVQDHQTKGDQPFQALVTEQIHVQPPSTIVRSEFAPLRGRKVLAFSDSRQTAARLAPNLQTYSMQDVMRPLIVYGFNQLGRSTRLKKRLSLDYLYLAVLLAAQLLGIRLRPALRTTEPFTEMLDVRRAIERGAPSDEDALLDVAHDVLTANPPHALLRAIVTTISHRYYSLESLALASICEAPKLTENILDLPVVAGLAETDEQKLALARLWLRCWRATGFNLMVMPSDWHGDVYRTHKGKFKAVERFLGDAATRRAFNRDWLPALLTLFTERMSATQHQLRGSKLSLLLQGAWAYCDRCRETQRPYPAVSRCVNCGSDRVTVIDPDCDPVFAARKSYYRASTLLALADTGEKPMSLIAAEHTAQLGAAQGDDVFSKAEEHELLFQDIDIGGHRIGRTAIDVLSCTTTMEVGIDIGALAGVALRNMPPARANYQQRAGRAGRRGTAIATVTAFGSADSHDEHYFSHPEQMIRGDVADPILNIDNPDIARRHVTAFLLQRYHADRLPEIAPEDQPQLFAVLGTVQQFRNSESVLNIDDFAAWLRDNQGSLREQLTDWLPAELAPTEREMILDNLVEDAVQAVGSAVVIGDEAQRIAKTAGDDATSEVAGEEDEEHPIIDPGSDKLLDRLLYRGILPRYAFPTDVATFHVFNQHESTRYRPVFEYAPSQGLATALSQYAPGKQVWIDSRLWTSGSVYAVMSSDRYQAWDERKLHFACDTCDYSMTVRREEAEKGDVRDCPACGSAATFGPARHWMRPPGFAHPIEIKEGTSPDDQPARSYATRAKLTAPITSNDARWNRVNDQVRSLYLRDYLLVTNRGPKNEGYNYCTRCGRVEPTVGSSTVLQAHTRPFPRPKDQACPGDGTATGIVLGTTFVTDVLLMSIRVEPPLLLKPGLLATDIALRSVCEAVTAAGCDLLELEHGELQAEYRPALTEGGQVGGEAEIYVYDTLPGGAGFSRHLEDLGADLFERALELLLNCPEGCDRSCYRCLRSYKNKLEHDRLDRHLGITLLHFMLNGGEPVINRDRLSALTDVLFQDLGIHSRSDLEIERNIRLNLVDFGEVTAPILVKRKSGQDMVFDIHGALTPNFASTPELRELAEYSLTPVHLLDETLVRRNLPSATRQVLDLVVAA